MTSFIIGRRGMRLRVPVKRLKLSSLLCFTIKFTTTIRRLTGRDLKWEDDPISLKSKSVIDKFPHADIEFYKQKIINFVEWI